MVVVKVLLMLTFGIIFFQDLKERMVYWFLFPLVGLCCGILYYFETLPELFFSSTLINLSFITILLGLVFLYIKFKLKTQFGNAFGLGDVFLFYMLCLSFGSLSFIIIFVSALIFALSIHLVFKKTSSTVPLAGYMCLFFGIIYISQWAGIINTYNL